MSCDCGFGICNGDGSCNCFDLWYRNGSVGEKCNVWVGDVTPSAYDAYLIIGVITSTLYWMFGGIVFFAIHRFKGRIRAFQRFGVILLIVSFVLIVRMTHDILAFSHKDIHKFTILLGFIWPTEISILYFQAVVWIFACKAVVRLNRLSYKPINVACVIITVLSFIIEIFVSFQCSLFDSLSLTCKFRAVPLMVGVQSSILLNIWRIYLACAALFVITAFWATHIFIHCNLKKIMMTSKAVQPSQKKQNRFRLTTKITVAMNITLIFSLVVPSLGFIFQNEPRSYVPINFVIRLFELAIATEFYLGVIWEVRRDLFKLVRHGTVEESTSEVDVNSSSRDKNTKSESVTLH